jgi:hypothetical protein
MDVINTYLVNKIREIVAMDDDEKPKFDTRITICMDIYNSNDVDHIIRPVVLDTFSIQQLFYLKFTDDIIVYAKFLPKDVYYLISNIESLQARVYIRYIDDTGKINNNRKYNKKIFFQ